MGISIVREKRNTSRFWGLFRPSTNNFQFWLASAAFSFFAYQTLYESRKASGMIDYFSHKILPFEF